MRIVWIGALAIALGLTGGGVPPVSAQTACQQFQVTTTRTSSPIAVTPLDAIAFPVQPSPATATVVRQILVCPPGATPPPAITPVPLMIGTPIFGTPVIETPVLVPVFGMPVSDSGARPSAAPGPPAAPPMVGAVPEDSVRALATQAARFDRTVVTVAGTATAVAPAADGRGTPITTFRLEAQGASVGVVVWGHATVRAGETVRVSGPFYVSTPFVGASGTPWHDVIEADLLER
ncbi:MAG TPA: hypothetical protein VGX75_00290 [bacterium]|nr:hypothetical protein [bacterium]